MAKRGRKQQKIFGEISKRKFASDYYLKHKSQIDKVIDDFKDRKNIKKSISNKDIFESEIVYGTNPKGWYSKKAATAAVKEKLYTLKGGDSTWYEAYHNIENKSVDLRYFNNKQGTWYEYEYGDESETEGKVIGYFDFGDANMLLTQVLYKIGKDSTITKWELRDKNAIGL